MRELRISSVRDGSLAKITQNFNKNPIMIVGKNSFSFLPFNKVSVSRTNNTPLRPGGPRSCSP